MALKFTIQSKAYLTVFDDKHAKQDSGSKEIIDETRFYGIFDNQLQTSSLYIKEYNK